MDPFIIYLVVAILALLLSVIVAFSFLKYRFKGDRTIAIIASFYLMFVVVAILTVSLLRSPSVPANPFS